MGWWRRQPLRTQLVVIVVVLGGLALTAAAFAATTALSSYLQGQIDQQLLQVTRADRGPMQPGPPGFDRRPDHEHEHDEARGLPGEFYVATVLTTGGVEVLSRPYDEGSPDLTAVSSIPVGRPTTVPGDDGSWRIVGVPSASGSLIVGKSLADVDRTLSRLVALQAAIGALVLGMLALVAFIAVRRSLRPLDEVEQTAVAIAAGDLARRVPEHPPTTEVGQLGSAFNTMLDEINSTIDQRDAALVEAQASEARMRQFVADASHELRTPLTSIRGYSELYRQGGVPTEAVPETLGRIESEAHRMGGLVDDLLLLARLDQQRPLDRESVDLLQVAADEVHAASVRDPGRRIRLTQHGDEVPVVTGDPARLRQVLANLIGNALKYGEGEVVVTVDSRTSGRVALTVRDHGPGIPDDEKAKIFERFYRGDPSRTRAAGGTGLGLSIVAAIVAAQGGSVAVSDASGGGTAFTVTLPSRNT